MGFGDSELKPSKFQKLRSANVVLGVVCFRAHQHEPVEVGIAIPGSRKFSNPEIPGLSRTQSRDFGINKIYVGPI